MWKWRVNKSKKATPDALSIKQEKTMIAYSQRDITVPRPVRSFRWFLQDSFILSFSLKNIPRSTPPHCLLSSLLHSHRFLIRNTTQRKGLCTSSKYVTRSRSKTNTSCPSPRHFVPRDENKLCTHDKNRKRAELWVKLIRLFNVFVMYALGSVHEKFNNLNRSRFVVKQTDWPCGT